MKVTLYTDGSSRGNPGPGGWGAILIVSRHQTTDNSKYDTNIDKVIELGGREPLTTNNRMELMAAIQGLREIDSRQQTTNDEQSGNHNLMSDVSNLKSVEIFTDSQYVKKGMSEWIDGWIKRGWKGSTKKPVLNQDLWQILKNEEDRLKEDNVKVIWTYVPGHAGVPLNERADTIATSCADQSGIELYRGPKSEYSFL